MNASISIHDYALLHSLACVIMYMGIMLKAHVHLTS